MNYDQIKKISYYYRYLILLSLYSLVVFTILFYVAFFQPANLNWDSSVNHRVGPTGFRLLDGVAVSRAKIALRPFATIIENQVDSRPTAGLEYASVVYETIVEGDITRYLAIFDGSSQVKKIGPIRSVRPFFISLAKQWDSVLFHAGGSEEALNSLKNGALDHINEISGDGLFFWRDYSRVAPHNLFTSSDLIGRAFAAKGYNEQANFKPWLFKNDSRPPTTTNQLIEVNLSPNPDYNVSFSYDFRTNGYLRYLGGSLHKTDRGIILEAKNVIIEHVRHVVIDDYGRLNINVTGGGQAEIYQDGSRINGSWRSVNGRTKYYDENNNEISLNRGSTWIELVF
ncbi:MAG: DUF3048 domain-containing protein [Patescibacteria group bacterium]|nr:DUF3048 domain-containing protein [Patescibacteria group bacterium]